MARPRKKKEVPPVCPPIEAPYIAKVAVSGHDQVSGEYYQLKVGDPVPKHLVPRLAPRGYAVQDQSDTVPPVEDESETPEEGELNG